MAFTGGTIYTDGAYTIHKFTSTDSFVVTTSLNVEALLVGGGGGAGTGDGAQGGGGAGGVVHNASLALTAQTYTVTVGAGGTIGNSGTASSIGTAISAPGGGRGGNYNAGNGVNGGCGGGGSGGYPSAVGYHGDGNPGYQGGDGIVGGGYPTGGGGGGMGAAGGNGSTNGGAGGDGISTYSDLLISAEAGVDISGVHWIAGGGGGGWWQNSKLTGAGGKGGGGGGDATGSAGTANTGGGGSGGYYGANGFSGGTGLVIVKYLTADSIVWTTNTKTVTTKALIDNTFYTKLVSAKASIKNTVEKTITAKAAISKYSYYASLTIDDAKVSGAGDLTNFPILVSGTYDGTGGIPDLRHTTHGGKVTSTSGFDIVFYSDVNMTTRLNHEIESYNHETGAIRFWVNVPTLDGDADTVIYIAYGNTTVTSSQESVNTWDANYKMVSHMHGASTIKDSTSTPLTFTKNGTINEVDAKVYKGHQMGGSGTSFVASPETDKLNIVNNLTVEAWYKHTAAVGSSYMFQHGTNQTYAIIWDGWQNLPWAFYDGAGGPGWRAHITTDTRNDTTNFHYLAYTQVTANVKAYLDGALETNDTSHNANLVSQSSSLALGGLIGSTYNPAIILDEVRVSNVVRSAEWIETTFNTISDPASFYAMGAETQVRVPAIKKLLGVSYASIKKLGGLAIADAKKYMGIEL